MNKRFWIICSVICMGLLVLSGLGLSSLGMYRKGLQAERQQEFMDVARRISFDVKQKVDAFLRTEQSRPYTEYQMYYVPEAINQSGAVTLVQSPLANTFNNDLATGYFQLESDGRLTSPHDAASWIENPKELQAHAHYFENVRRNLLPSLQSGQTVATHRIGPADREQQGTLGFDTFVVSAYRQTTTRTFSYPETPRVAGTPGKPTAQDEDQAAEGAPQKKQVASESKDAKNPRSVVYPISNLKKTQQVTQVLTQSRGNYMMNMASNSAVQQDRAAVVDMRERTERQPQQAAAPQAQQDKPAQPQQQQLAQRPDTVQVRIEPLVPITVPDPGGGNGIFAGQIFLLRHVQIEDRHLIQGFQLNEDALLTQITDSAQQAISHGMGYEISKTERPNAAFAAILQFDFGDVVLNLLEKEPGLILARVQRIRNWFYGILGVVWLSVLIAMAALWKNLHEQALLSRKKDDFISAVSHELRTPLTSIRMYTEMLEKNWIKTDDKRSEYYTTMRTESERLTRLIENVLDFSRIQRGKKRYDFTLGDVNGCIAEVADIMRPHIERAGFTLEQQYETLPEFAFDRDAVVQIVINLLDNALKYAKDAQDRHIIIRTRKQKHYVVIEVEDRGPGIPRSWQKKIFDAFYRCEDESTRQNTGTGLGLALVKRFAEAHHGFVEIANAKPTGALFRVGLTTGNAGVSPAR